MVGKRDYPKEKTSNSWRLCFLDNFGSGELITSIPITILVKLVAVEVPLARVLVEVAINRDPLYPTPSVPPPLGQTNLGLNIM